jgi:LysR family transcriptional regulator for bpeEF and oprC
LDGERNGPASGHAGVYTRVVDTNSFSRAADTLDLPRASVTTIIQNLEAFLGTCG